jgi:ankyrin repeat protein
MNYAMDPPPGPMGILEAIELRKPDLFLQYLQRDPNLITLKVQQGQTLLHIVCRQQWIQGVHCCVPFFQQTPLGLDDQDADGQTALYIASAVGFYEGVQYLLQHHAQVDLQNKVWVAIHVSIPL